MSLSISISFKTEQFDYKSELPEDVNAGNRFYGKDVAAFLVAQLSLNNLHADYVDEDWGWLVFSLQEQTPIFEIAVYNLAENRGANEGGIPEWGLWIRAYKKRKVLGFLTKRDEMLLPPEILHVIEDAIRAVGATPLWWEDGPKG